MEICQVSAFNLLCNFSEGVLIDYFVRTHNVPLVDEYDNIMRDIGIFAAFSPRELNNRLHESSKLPDTFTLSFHNGQVTTERTLGKIPAGEGNGRIKGQVDLLKDHGVPSWVPDCRMAISLHDHPRIFIGNEHRSELLSRAEERECKCLLAFSSMRND